MSYQSIIKLQQQADERARLRKTEPIPDIDFWLAVGRWSLSACLGKCSTQ